MKFAKSTCPIMKGKEKMPIFDILFLFLHTTSYPFIIFTVPDQEALDNVRT